MGGGRCLSHCDIYCSAVYGPPGGGSARWPRALTALPARKFVGKINASMKECAVLSHAGGSTWV